MKPILLIHGYSAESKRTTKPAIRKIYHSLPADLKKQYQDAVLEVDLSRWISLEDGVTIDDISFALNRALNSEPYRHLTENGFNVIIHSTGALIIRNWIRAYSQPERCGIGRIVYLAGANFGSGWAHVGMAQLAKWGREVFKGEEAGVRVLRALELGASWTLDLHLHFTRPKCLMRKNYRVQEFCIVGSQAKEGWFPIPIRYAKEDGADGVVRVASCNLNINYLKIVATEKGRKVGWKELKNEVKKDLTAGGHQASTDHYDFLVEWRAEDTESTSVPFAIPYDCSHSGDKTGVVGGKDNREQVLRLIDVALGNRSWASKLKTFRQETDATYEKARTHKVTRHWKKLVPQPPAQYDPHAQVIFRIVDQFGDPVKPFDIFFDALPGKRPSATPINALMQHKHVNGQDKNIICFFLRTETFNKERAKDQDTPYPWDDQVAAVGGCRLEISAGDPETGDIRYLPLHIRFEAEELKKWIRSHQTTLIDVELLRLPSVDVFKIVKD